MTSETTTPVFQNLLKDRVSNDPTAWTQVGALIDRFAAVVKGDLLCNLRGTVRAAEEASAILFCATMIAKQKNIELGFYDMINEAKGRTFGARLINWSIDHMDGEIASDLKVAWAGQHQHMSSAIEMMIRELEPVGTNVVPEQVIEWIKNHGGLGNLHMKFMNYRQAEVQREKAIKEQDRKRGAEARRLAEATEAGFDSIEAYDAHLASVVKEKREADLKSKFGQVKKRLISNGGTAKPVEGQLVIVSGGKFFALSEADEYSLLSCAASVL
jgi:hypothetical protein